MVGRELVRAIRAKVVFREVAPARVARAVVDNDVGDDFHIAIMQCTDERLELFGRTPTRCLIVPLSGVIAHIVTAYGPTAFSTGRRRQPNEIKTLGYISGLVCQLCPTCLSL